MKLRRFLPLVLLMGLFLPLVFVMGPAGAGGATQQPTERYFPETGHWVRGGFLAYWDAHGGMAQQGYPLTGEFSEVSTTDGRTYTVQYFERTVFEYHPENAGTPYEILLSLAGVDAYRQKYPQGAPDQRPHPASRLFPETGKRLGGSFRDYWEHHGGLSQQGFPISEEFTEVSALDGKPYTVQYFERAVFEYHPEYLGSAYEVLLSQLGTYRYQARHGSVITPRPSPTRNYPPTTPGPGTPWPTFPPSPTVAPPPPRPTGTPPTPLPTLAIPTPQPGYEQVGLYGSDQYLIWTENRPDVPSSGDVVGLELATGRRISIAAGAEEQLAMGLVGANAVWQEYQWDGTTCVRAANLYRKTLPDGPPVLIARSESAASGVAALGDAVAWVTHDCSEGAHVRLWAGGVVQSVWDTADGVLSAPAVSDHYLAWVNVLTNRLVIYNRATRQTSEVGIHDPVFVAAPALYGDTVFWSDGTLQYLRLDTSQWGVVMEGGRHPLVYGPTLLWQVGGDVWGMRLPEGTPTRLVPDCAFGACEVTVAGDWLVWGQRGAWHSAGLDALFAHPPSP